MRLRRADWLFVVFAVTVVAGVSFLPTPKDRNPMVPRTAEHQAAKSEQQCVGCHKSDGREAIAGAPSQAAGLSALSRAASVSEHAGVQLMILGDHGQREVDQGVYAAW